MEIHPARSRESSSTRTDLLPGLEELWSETQGHPEIRIAVLDGPVDLSHPCFEGARLEVKSTLVPVDGAGSVHGTHVASLIFGQHGRSPVRGIAPRCTGLILPVFSPAEGGAVRPCSQLDLARAILQAMEAGAHVINISGGELSPSGQAVDVLADAVRQAAERNVLIVAAAGNDGCECLHMPAGLPPVLGVGALDAEGRPLTFSNWSTVLADRGLMAPGAGILGAFPGGGVARLSGTSFAVPQVSGAAALLVSLQRERGRNVDPAAVRELLLRTARPCDPAAVNDCRRLLRGSLDIAAAHAAQAGAAPSQAISSRGPAPAGPSVLNHPFHPFRGGGQTIMNSEPVVSAPEAVSASGEGASIITSCACGAGPEPAKSPELFVPSSSSGLLPAPAPQPSVTPSVIAPACNSDFATAMRPFPSGQKVFTLGRLYYDFGTEARRDYFAAQVRHQLGPKANIYNPADMMKYLYHKGKEGESWDHTDDAIALIWTLYIDQDPVYALIPQDQFAVLSFSRLIDFLKEQTNIEKPTEAALYRVAAAGTMQGTVTLFNGTVVPAISLSTRAMWSWSLAKLVKAVQEADMTAEGESGETSAPPASSMNPPPSEEFQNFLLRIYHEMRNLGVTSQERAKNYAATNAFQAHKIFQKVAQKGQLKLDTISVERSPICRRDSDCWDVKLKFFDPKNLFQVARTVYEYTIDVSDLVPVQVGDHREYQIYGSPGS